jgi:carbon monoxide dehydrogenase subunit G
MHFEGEFRVPGKADDVIRRFADVPRMARCVPGARLEPQVDDGSWPGAMVVSFGPKKISFKGRVSCDFDFAAKTGSLHGRGAADMRAARIGVKVAFALRDAADAGEPATIVKVTSDAELGGVLADFARTGGVAVANVIMQDFARRASEEFARDVALAAATAASTSEPAAAATPAIHKAAREAAAPATHKAAPAAGEALTLAARTAATAATPEVTSPATPEAAAPATPEVTPSAARETATPAMCNPTAPRTPQDVAPATLAAHRVLWAVFKYKLQQLAAWLGFRAKDAS